MSRVASARYTCLYTCIKTLHDLWFSPSLLKHKTPSMTFYLVSVRAIFAGGMFINKPFQIETLQKTQTMKPLSRVSNSQLLVSLITINKIRLLSHSQPRVPESLAMFRDKVLVSFSLNQLCKYNLIERC